MWNANCHGEVKVKIVKRGGQVIWSVSAVALARGWERRVRAKAGADPRDGQRPRGVPGEQSITHLRAEGALTPGSWAHSASQVTPWPLRTAKKGRGEGINLIFGVCLFLLAKGEWGEQLLHLPLNARGLAPSTCSDLEREVTGTCRQEPLTYIKKVYPRESVYISINISCIYINKYIKIKECIILMQHKAVLRERVSKYEHCNLGYTDLGKRKDVFDCLFCIFTVLF